MKKIILSILILGSHSLYAEGNKLVDALQIDGMKRIIKLAESHCHAVEDCKVELVGITDLVKADKVEFTGLKHVKEYYELKFIKTEKTSAWGRKKSELGYIVTIEDGKVTDNKRNLFRTYHVE